MATSKLTLSIDRDTIELAKRLASENNISVSKLFKRLITDINKKRRKTDPIIEKYKDVRISNDILALTGVLKGMYPDEMDYKDMKYEYLKDKYDL